MNGFNFTERIRRVLALSREESVRLRHEYVGTEHLLLGLIREGENIALAVLTNLDADLQTITQQVEGIIRQGKSNAPTGHDLPYTSRAKKVLELAMSEAARFKHTYVGTEHLLLGLIAEEKGIAAQILAENRIRLDAARNETLRLLGSGGGPDPAIDMSPPGLLYPPELDAIIAAPENHRVLMENEYVRVLETIIDPGEKTSVHVHRWPASHQVLSWSNFVRRDEAGNILLDTRTTEMNENPPQFLWGSALPAHTVENVGDTRLHIISTELKKAVPSPLH